MMKKKLLAGLTFGIFLFGLAVSANATLLTGAINDLPESGAYGTGSYYWGDGVNDLFQEWSANTMLPEGSGINYGWFYASNYSNSNADVYLYSGLADISTITDASIFSYTTADAILGGEGDTVFFRGTNGYYGAWRIDDIYVNPAGNVFPYTFLTGQWYFQDDGTGNFSDSPPIPEPATMLLLVTGIAGLAGIRIRRKKK